MKRNVLTIANAFLITILLVVSSTGLAVLYAFLLIRGVKMPDFYYWHFDISMSSIVLIPAILLLRRRYGLKRNNYFKKNGIPVFSIFVVLMLLLFFVIQPLVNPVETYKKAQNGIWFIHKINFSEIDIGVLIIMGFLIPVTEELFFRGIILKQFLENYSVGKSLIWSSIIFAAWHILANPFGLVYLFIIGLLFGYSFYKSRTVLLPIALHILNNVLAINTVKEYADFNTYFLNKWLMFFLVCLGLIVILLRFLGKYHDKTITTLNHDSVE